MLLKKWYCVMPQEVYKSVPENSRLQHSVACQNEEFVLMCIVGEKPPDQEMFRTSPKEAISVLAGMMLRFTRTMKSIPCLDMVCNRDRAVIDCCEHIAAMLTDLAAKARFVVIHEN